MEQLIIASHRPLQEFVTDPALTIACVLLVVVSIGWIVVWRMILRAMKRAAIEGRRVEVPKKPRDIWALPP